LENLVAISSYIGKNLDLIQGAGGNTSLKENNILWVKASGCRLKDAGSRNIFVPVDYCSLMKRLSSNANRFFEPAIVSMEDCSILRPSIETSLHALMPHRYVIHTHSVNAIANAVLDDSKAIICRLLKDMNWSWVPYVRPGMPLTRAVQKVIRSGLNILVLANHGLVLGGDSKGEIYELLDEVEDKLHRPRRDPKKVVENEITSLVNNTNYLPSKYSLTHSLAFDSQSLSIAGTGPLYPDHIVFLGMGPMPIMTGESFRNYLADEKREVVHKVIIVKGVGVIKHQSLSDSAEEMLHCLANVLLRIKPEKKLRYLTKLEEVQIAGWDAEKFRQSTQS
jgi:rhamnose utilization protein RhaD (predicted bifunctional aldolase and dehydrogenase)